jgi:hypothetical protein
MSSVPNTILPRLGLAQDENGNQQFPIRTVRHQLHNDHGDERERQRRRQLADSLRPRGLTNSSSSESHSPEEDLEEDIDMDIDEQTIQEIKAYASSSVSLLCVM